MFSQPCSKEEWKKQLILAKRIFQGREIVEGFFLIDGLSQMTPILNNSLLSQKEKLSGMIKWGHMNVYIFTWKHSQSNAFFLELFFGFTRSLRHPHQMCSTSNFWLNGLGSPNSGAQIAWANKPMACTHILVEAKMWLWEDKGQRCQIYPFYLAL